MEIIILAFGIAKDIFKADKLSLNLGSNLSVANLKYELENQYPSLKELKSYMIAINNNYALSTDIIKEKDEIALIPPVSGG